MNCLAFLSRAFSASRPLSCKSLDPEYPDSDNCVLRVIRVIRDSDKEHMSPRWGFGYLVCVACYKHVAPLGLNAGQFAVGHPSWGRDCLAKYPMCCAIVVCSLSQEYCMTLLVSWVTQRLRVQPCATIPHCAPLERGDWRCRAAIDISLLWSERRDNLRWVIRRIGLVSSPNTLMCCAIVVCSLSQEYCMTLLVSWVTQRLRVQPCATIPHCAPLERGDWRCRAAIDISLLWSERQTFPPPFNPPNP